MYVYVGFYGDFDPHELLNLLAPRGAVLEVRRAGEPLRFAPKMAECDSLEVKIAKRPTYDLEGLLDE
ncbi:MAG: hypothetical protein Q4C67_03370, partial [Deinococcus sp.]|nr:hypothetical protein [Deinococcus sp.]